MSDKFSKQSLEYFAAAKKNANKPAWFEKNKTKYHEHVQAPMFKLVEDLNKVLGNELREFNFSPKKVSKPVTKADRKKDGAKRVQAGAWAYFSETRTSMFEWNPGIYISVGHNHDGNMLGIGLYFVSGRQLSLLRNAIVEDYDNIHAILKKPALKKAWGELVGDKYKRFPKGFSPDIPAAKYLWHKQFFLHREISNKDLLSKDFNKKTAQQLRAALPFLQWIRRTVGTYKKPNSY